MSKWTKLFCAAWIIWLIFALSSTLFGQVASVASRRREKTALQFSFGSFSTVAPFNSANNYTTIPTTEQLQPSAATIDSNDFSSTGSFTTFTSATPPTFSVSGNQGVVSFSAGSQYIYLFDTGTSYAIGGPAIFATIEVDQTTGMNQAMVGIGKDTSNWIRVAYSASASNLAVAVDVAGSSSNPLIVSSVTLTAPFTLGMSIVGSKVGIWTNSGGGWLSRGSVDISATYDPRTDGNLTSWQTFSLVSSSGSGTTKISKLKNGAMGGVNVRDISLVTYPDGRPYINGSTAYFTANLVGLDGVFTYDLGSGTLTQIGVIMNDRSGKVYNDTASHLIYNPANTTYRYLVAGFGNESGSSTQTFYASFSKASIDVLSPGLHVVAATLAMTLPLNAAKGWDTHLACTNWNYSAGTCGKWVVAWSSWGGANNYYPAAAYSTSDPSVDSWTLIGSDSTLPCHEGARIIRTPTTNGSSGVTYVAAFAGSSCSTTRATEVYSLGSFSNLGSLSATLPAAGSSGNQNAPHPTVFPFGNSEYFVTFNDNLWNSVSTTMGNWLAATAPKY